MSSIYGSASGANVIYGKNNTGVAFAGAATPEPTPDYEEDFLTDPTSGDWTNNGASVTYDASEDNIALDPNTGDNAADFKGLLLDLQDVLGENLDNEKFVVQFVWTATSWTEATTPYYDDIGVWLQKLLPSSVTNLTNSGFKFGGGNTGGAVAYSSDYQIGGNFEFFWAAFRTPARDVAGETQFKTFNVAPVTGTTIGVRLIRTGVTGFKSELYADADFTNTPTVATLTDTTMLSGIDDVRYLLLAGYSELVPNGVNEATFDSLKIWNGINL